MSDFLLEQICIYLRKGIILVKFDKIPCLEEDLYIICIFTEEGKKIDTFKIERYQMDTIKLIATVENLKGIIK